MIGIAVGVWALIVVLSVMNGFQKEVRTRILGVAFVSGVNLYATVLVVGLGIHYHWVAGLPPELDVLADALVDAGAYGARLTGAGFGGCVVGLVAAGGVDDIVARAGARYRSTTGLTPVPLVVRAVDGAGLVT